MSFFWYNPSVVHSNPVQIIPKKPDRIPQVYSSKRERGREREGEREREMVTAQRLVCVCVCAGADLVNWGCRANIGMGPYTFALIYQDQPWGSFFVVMLAAAQWCPIVVSNVSTFSCTCYNGILSFTFTFIHLADTFILSCWRQRNSNWFTFKIQVLTKN